jgi:ABC-type polysaccharide/polyol phosphate transport system ATPase subunit
VSSARILVLASHSMPLLQQWCDRAILLDQGRIVHSGPVSEVAEAYAEREGRPVKG